VLYRRAADPRGRWSRIRVAWFVQRKTNMCARRQVLGLLMSCCLLAAPVDDLAARVARKDLGQLYDRIAADLTAGRPLVATIYVALCDNDSQGIVKVRNRRICRGDDPDRNLYWAAAGGLAATLRAARWQRVLLERFDTGELAVKAVWRKRLSPSGMLRSRGVTETFDAYILGLGYRGAEIRKAMVGYLEAVNGDRTLQVCADGAQLVGGGASHLVGYIGHDYFYDVDDPQPLWALREGVSTLQKGTFALSCTGHRLIRPAIRRLNAHILMLNRSLGFPGAWTAEALVTGIAAGRPARALYRSAASAFAAGRGVSLGVALAAFAYGD